MQDCPVPYITDVTTVKVPCIGKRIPGQNQGSLECLSGVAAEVSVRN